MNNFHSEWLIEYVQLTKKNVSITFRYFRALWRK